MHGIIVSANLKDISCVSKLDSDHLRRLKERLCTSYNKVLHPLQRAKVIEFQYAINISTPSIFKLKQVLSRPHTVHTCIVKNMFCELVVNH